MKKTIAFVLGLFLVISISTVSPAQNKSIVKDEYGVSYSADGMAVTVDAKRDQLFRVINMVRESHSLPSLSYEVYDQGQADLRIVQLSRSFNPDTLTCNGEVIVRGTFAEITALTTRYTDTNNLHLRADVHSASIALRNEDKEKYLAVIRLF